MTVARARARTRLPIAAAASPTVEDVSDPRIARMRQALELTAAGRSQVEIGRVLNCAPRTVRDLLKEGRARQVATFRSRSAEAIVADVEHRASVQYGRWTALYVRARQAGDLRAETAILARMDQAIIGRVAMLARVGFFDNVTFHNGGQGNEDDRRAQKARREIDYLVTLSAALNRGDDVDSVEIVTDDDTVNFDPLDPLY